MGILKYFRGSVWNYEFTDGCNDTHVTLGKHPCVVISNDILNVRRCIVTVLPITSKVKEEQSLFNVTIPSVRGDKEGSAVMCNQARTVDIRDLYDFCGVLDPSDMARVDEKLKFMLGFETNEEFAAGIEADKAVEIVFGDSAEEKNEEIEPVEQEEATVGFIDEPKNDIPTGILGFMKAGNNKITWNGETKRQFLVDYEVMKVDDVVQKYGLSNIKAARQKAYQCRKQVGNTRKYKKMKKVGA